MSSRRRTSLALIARAQSHLTDDCVRHLPLQLRATSARTAASIRTLSLPSAVPILLANAAKYRFLIEFSWRRCAVMVRKDWRSGVSRPRGGVRRPTGAWKWTAGLSSHTALCTLAVSHAFPAICGDGGRGGWVCVDGRMPARRGARFVPPPIAEAWRLGDCAGAAAAVAEPHAPCIDLQRSRHSIPFPFDEQSLC